MVKQLLTFVRGGEGQRKPIDLSHIIKEVSSLARQTFPRNLQISYDIERGLPLVQADAVQIHQVLMNLCINARDAMPQGGKLLISGKSVSRSFVLIEVTDTGIGMSGDTVNKIFDPFFTTKAPGKGTGLGLSTSLGIVKSHGGELAVETQLGVGTTFKLSLPATTEAGI